VRVSFFFAKQKTTKNIELGQTRPHPPRAP
jgi:hypothetical protein